MSRLQLALNVDDLEQSIAFYTSLFGTGPAKVKPGYANFAVTEPALKLVLIENPGRGGSLNHLGVEVTEQDKFWVEGAPNGERWEVYTVLEDTQDFGQHAGENEMTDPQQSVCCS